MTKKDSKGIVRLGGKDYHTVGKRIADFRADYPIKEGWGIYTEIVAESTDPVYMRLKATITSPHGRTVATGYAQEFGANRGVNATSLLENCETSAIGRALAAAGYVGSGQYASADEVIAAEERGAEFATPRPTKPQRPFRHPLPPAIHSAAQSLRIGPRVIADYCQDQGWGEPSVWAPDQVEAFIADLRAGKHPDLYRPPVAEQQTSPHGIPVPAEFTEDHHPSWKEDAKRFCAAIRDLDGLRYADLADWLSLIHDMPRPSQIDNHERGRLYKWLRYHEGREAIAADVDKIAGLRADQKRAQAEAAAALASTATQEATA